MKDCKCNCKSKCCKILVGIPVFLAVVAAGAAAVMLLWNWLIPPIFGWTAIGYCQALGLFALCKILFGHPPHGMRGCHGHHGCGCGDKSGDDCAENQNAQK